MNNNFDNKFFPLPKNPQPDAQGRYIDGAGNIVINSEFVEGDYFSERVASVKSYFIEGEPFKKYKEDNFGYISYDNVDIETKYGFIDYAGDYVIPPQFDFSRSFSNGLAAVEINHKFGYIDKEGRFVIEPQFGLAFDFYEDSAVICSTKGYGIVSGKFGLIDRTGNFILKQEYDTIEPFSEGLAAVEKQGHYIYIDTSGKMIIDIVELIHNTPELKSLLQQGVKKFGNELWRLINIKKFNNGLAPLGVSGKYGYINKTGKLVISPQFDNAFDFSEGLAHVKIEGKYGYIDTIGEIVIKPQFAYAAWFSDGLADISFDDELTKLNTGFIDKEGHLILPCEYTCKQRYKNGLAFVVREDKSGYMNKNGDFVWQTVTLEDEVYHNHFNF